VGSLRFQKLQLQKYPPGKKKEPILMKTKMRNSISGLLVIPLLLVCFALLPRVQASPDPPALGGGNVRDGSGTLAHRTTGTFNSAFGTNALNSLTTGNNNAAQGNSALFTANGSKNTAVGVIALRLNASGADNTAIGYKALNMSLGSNNTAVGSGAGTLLSSGSNNIFIGNDAGSTHTSANNAIMIGVTEDPNASSLANRCYIGQIRGITPGGPVAAIPVYIDGDGQLGTTTSSRRFKKDIEPMDKTSEAILALKPVTFHYKDMDTKKAQEIPQFGLIAEDVNEVNPDLVVYDNHGEIQSVRYDAVSVMLLNEFLKEHKKVEEQQASIADLKSTVALQQKGMEVLTAQLKEQASQIQKVSAQVEVNKTAPRTVANK
jgi:hypothetical protein